MVQRMKRDAEVDALKARLAAAEARAERAVGMLGEAHDWLRACANDVDDRQAWDMEARGALARKMQHSIAALLREVSGG